MGFWSGIGEALFGTESKKQGKKLQAQAASQASTQQETATKQAEAAGAQAAQYGAGVQQSMGANAQEYMQKQQQAASGQAAQTAAYQAQQATKQGVKAARTAGVNPGQAALMAGRQTADAYGGAYQQGLEQGMNRYGQATGQFAGMQGQMANQQMGQQQIASGATGQIAGAGQAATAQGQQTAATTWGTIGNLAGVGASLINNPAGAVTSDERAKKNIWDVAKSNINRSKELKKKRFENNMSDEQLIDYAYEYPTDAVLQYMEDRGLLDQYLEKYYPGKETGTQDFRVSRPEYPDDDRPTRLEFPEGRMRDNNRNILDQVTEKVKPVTFDYKGEKNGTNHLGVLAQDLEKTPLRNAVKTDEAGVKMIDTAELSPGLLNLIIQLSKKVDQLGGNNK